MMSRVVDLEWIVTNTEVEALLVEANLIKEHAPKYNVSLKDDKSFPYVRITREPFPQVIITRKIVKDGSKYFGPYTDVKSLRGTFKVSISASFKPSFKSLTLTPPKDFIVF